MVFIPQGLPSAIDERLLLGGRVVREWRGDSKAYSWGQHEACKQPNVSDGIGSKAAGH